MADYAVSTNIESIVHQTVSEKATQRKRKRKAERETNQKRESYSAYVRKLFTMNAREK